MSIFYSGINASSTSNFSTINVSSLNITQTTGDINIASGSSNSCNINIKNGNTNTGSVNIASGTGTTAVNIGSGTTSGKVTIGNSTNNLDIKSNIVDIGAFRYSTDTINSRTNSDMYIANSLESATLHIGTGYTTRTGAIRIGDNSREGERSTVYISSGTTTGQVTIGNVSNTTTIGSGTLNVNGRLIMGPNTLINASNASINNLSVKNLYVSNTIDAQLPSQTLSIGTSQTSGVLNLGTGVRTGDVNIATAPSNNCSVNIMNGTTNGGSVNIANGVGPTQTTTVNIGNGQTNGWVNIGNPANNVVLNGASILIANNSVGGIVQIKNVANSVGRIEVLTATTGVNTTPVSISTGTTTGSVSIGSGSNQTILGSETITVNSRLIMGPNTLINASNASLTNLSVNNLYVSNAIDAQLSSQSLSIGASQYSGDLNLGTGNRTGSIIIGNGASASSMFLSSRTINIQNVINTGGEVNIKSNIGNTGSVNIANGALGSPTVSTNIGAGNTTGQVTIGNVSNTTTIGSGTLNVNSRLIMGPNTLINASNASLTNLSVNNLSVNNVYVSNAIDAQLPSQTLSIGASQTSGVLNLGTNTERTPAGAINIGNSNASSPISVQTLGTISIGTGLATQNTTRSVYIGGTDTTLTREYDVYINNIKFKLYNGGCEWNLQDQNSNLPFYLFGRQSQGALHIAGGNSVTRSGSVNIAVNTGNSCDVNIANSGGATTGGSVNIANGTAQTTTVNIASGTGTGTVTIGNSQNTTNMNSSTLNVGTDASRTGPINIGSTSNTGQIKIQTSSTLNSYDNPAILIGGGTSMGTSGRVIRIGNCDNNSTHFIGNLGISTNVGSNQVCLINTVQNQHTNDLNIGGGQKTGKLNLGGGAYAFPREFGGDINIGVKAGNACDINIMNDTTTSGNVNIANGTGITQTTAVNIGSGSTTGTVTIGNSANTTNVSSGTINLANATGATSNINILNGGAATGGSVNIANVGANTTAINIGSSEATGTINIKKGTGEINITTRANMNIGAENGIDGTLKTIYINGYNLGSSRTYTTQIMNMVFKHLLTGDELHQLNESDTVAFNFLNRQSTSALNIACGVGGIVRALTAKVNIASEITGTLCPVNILTADGTTTLGSVNVANGISQSTPVNIVANTGTGLVTIGNSANTTTIGSGTLNVNGRLIMGPNTLINASNASLTNLSAISINATTFTGALTGAASNAINIEVSNQTDNGSNHYPIFVSGISGTRQPSADTQLVYVPKTNTLTVGTVVGALNTNTIINASNASVNNMSIINLSVTGNFSMPSTAFMNVFNASFTNVSVQNITATSISATTFTGNATTATNATNAANSAVTLESSSASLHYPTFVSAATATNQGEKVSGNLTYTPSTNTLTATTFRGNLDANAVPLSIGTNATQVNVANVGANATVINIGSKTGTGGIAIETRGNMSIATNQTTGELTIGGGDGVTRTGNIRIGSQSGNNYQLDLYTANGLTTEGSVNIANGTQQKTVVNIVTNTGTGLVTIGNSANTTTIGSGTLNVNGRLIMGPNTLINASNASLTNLSVNILKVNSTIQLNDSKNNCAIGQNALFLNVSGTANTAFGYEALYSNTSSGGNTAVGYQALKNNNILGDVYSSNNTAVGYRSLATTTTGLSNCAFGRGSLELNTTGSNNHAFGNSALLNNTTGTSNIAIGFDTNFLNKIGSSNIGIGFRTSYSNMSGSNNVAIGDSALSSNASNNNIAIGHAADGYTRNINSINNVAIGFRAYTAPESKNTIQVQNSTAIGANANCNGFSNSTALGANATNTTDNQIMLGTNSQTVIILSNVSINTSVNIGSIINASNASINNLSVTNINGLPYGTISSNMSFTNLSVTGNFSMPSTAFMNVFNASINNLSVNNLYVSNAIDASVPIGTLSIGSSQTDGILNLGTNSGRTATGVINIGNSTCLAPINIETASNKNLSTDPAISIGTSNVIKTIKIGSSAVTQRVNVGGMEVLSTPGQWTLNGVTPNDAIVIGGTQSSNYIYIGAGQGVQRSGGIYISGGTGSSDTVQIKGGNNATGNLIAFNGTNATGSTDFYNNSGAGGNFRVYSGSGAGGTIGLATSNTGINTTSVNIASGTTTGGVTIGNSANTTTLASAILNVNGQLIMGTNTLINASNASVNNMSIINLSVTGNFSMPSTAFMRVFNASFTNVSVQNITATSISATTFTGNATTATTATNATNATTAATATNLTITADTTNGSDHYLTFVPLSTTGNQGEKVSSNLKYKPSTNTLTAGTFSGALTGTATTATNSTNLAVTSDIASTSDHYLTFVPLSTTGNQGEKVSSNLKYKPSTNTLTAGTFSGNLNTNSLINASNASVNNMSIINLSVTGNFSMPSTAFMNVFNASFTNVSFTTIANGSTIITQSLINASNASITNLSVTNINGLPYGTISSNMSFTNLSVTGNFSMPSTAYMNVSNASFTNIETASIDSNKTMLIGASSQQITIGLTIPNSIVTIGSSTNEQVGYSCAINAAGTIVAVGSPYYPGGRVQIYQYGTTWTKIGTDIIGSSEELGFSCAINAAGNIVAVGSPSYQGVGRVQIYQNSGGTWTKIGSDITGSSGDSLGTSCAINAAGTIVAVGCPYYGGGSGTFAGRIQIYQNPTLTGNWTQIGSDISGSFTGTTGEILGWSCTINASGTIFAVSSRYYQGGSGTFAGRIQIYQNPTLTGNWTKIGTDISGSSGEQLGYSCAINAAGTIVAVGCPYYGGGSGTSAGRIQMYQNPTLTGNWTQIGSDISGSFTGTTGEQLGISCAINAAGNIVAVGSPYYQGSGSNQGRVQIYENSIGTWKKNTLYIGPNKDIFGRSCKINSAGTIVAVGSAYYQGANSIGKLEICLNGTNGTITTIGNASISNLTCTGTINMSNPLFNTAIGNNALLTNITNINGSYNTAIGYNALNTPIGSYNTAIGANANCSGFSQSTAIGFNASNTANNQIVLGNATETVLIPGPLSGNSAIFTGQVQAATFNSTSDYKLKENIFYLNEEFNIEQLKPCQFNFINSSVTQIGFIAQDVEKVIPLSVTTTNDLKGIDYSSITAASIITIKKLLERVEILENLLKKHNIT
jgi:hypothetical protein